MLDFKTISFINNKPDSLCELNVQGESPAKLSISDEVYCFIDNNSACITGFVHQIQGNRVRVLDRHGTIYEVNKGVDRIIRVPQPGEYLEITLESGYNSDIVLVPSIYCHLGDDAILNVAYPRHVLLHHQEVLYPYNNYVGRYFTWTAVFRSKGSQHQRPVHCAQKGDVVLVEDVGPVRLESDSVPEGAYFSYHRPMPALNLEEYHTYHYVYGSPRGYRVTSGSLTSVDPLRLDQVTDSPVYQQDLFLDFESARYEAWRRNIMRLWRKECE